MKPAVAVLMLMLLFDASAVAGPRPHPSARRIPITVTSNGFEPARICATAGRRVVLVVTRTTDDTCAKEFVIATRKINRPLPLNQPVAIRLGHVKRSEIRFACGMDMVAGTLVVK
jgi:plastocyanin domain-containing protein